jgi:hypothetical protein
MYSSTDKSADVVEVGDKDGDCTISCKQDGRRRPDVLSKGSGAGARYVDETGGVDVW